MAEEKPSWVKMKPAEMEKLVVELAKKGETPEKIGLILRDKHGIPKAKLLGKKVGQILKENKLLETYEKDTVFAKTDKIKEHIAKNKHDYTAQRSLTKHLWAQHRIKVKEAQ